MTQQTKPMTKVEISSEGRGWLAAHSTFCRDHPVTSKLAAAILALVRHAESASPPAEPTGTVCRDEIAEVLREVIESVEDRHPNILALADAAIAYFKRKCVLSATDRNCIEQARAIGVWADAHGWNGIDNSKILSQFVKDLFDDLQAKSAVPPTLTDEQWLELHHIGRKEYFVANKSMRTACIDRVKAIVAAYHAPAAQKEKA